MDFTEQELLIERLDNWGRVYGERRAPGSPRASIRKKSSQKMMKMMKMCRFERYRCYGSVTDRRGHP